MPHRKALALLLLLLAPALGCGRTTESTDVRVRVGNLALDPVSNSFVLILEEQGGDRRLPIWIGRAEARSIASELEQERRPRPNTHDLAKRLVDRLEGALERVVVTDLSDGVYYALIDLRGGGRRMQVDSRPSDAIALALRYKAPVFVREVVFRRSQDLHRTPLLREPPEGLPGRRGAPRRL